MNRSGNTKKRKMSSSKNKPKLENTKVDASSMIRKKKLKQNCGHYGECSSVISDDESKLWAAELDNMILTYEEPSLSTLDVSSISKFLLDSKMFMNSHVKLIDYISMETLEMLSIMSEIDLLILLKLKNEELWEFLSVYKNYHIQEVDIKSKDILSISNTGPPKDLQLIFMSMPESGGSFVSKLEEYYSEFSKVLKHPINKDLYTRHELKKMFASGLALEDIRSEANRMYFEDFQEIFGWAYNKLVSLDRRKGVQEAIPRNSLSVHTSTNHTNTRSYNTNEKSNKSYPKMRLTDEHVYQRNPPNHYNSNSKKESTNNEKFKDTRNQFRGNANSDSNFYGNSRYEGSRYNTDDVKCNKCNGYGHYGYECTVCIVQKVSSSNDVHRTVLEKEYNSQKKSVRFDKSTAERMLLHG